MNLRNQVISYYENTSLNKMGNLKPDVKLSET